MAPTIRASPASGKARGQLLATDCRGRPAATEHRCHAEPCPAPAAPRPAAAGRPGDPRRSPGGSTTRSATCRSSPRTGTSTPRILADDVPFADPTTLFISPTTTSPGCCTPAGSPLDDLGVGRGPAARGRRPAQAWRLLCANWHAVPRHAGAVLVRERAGRDLRRRPCGRRRQTADAIYDQIAERLASRTPTGRGRCCERFGIEVLATTDDPADDLAAHAALAADPASPAGSLPDLPARPLPGAGAPGLGRRGRRGSARSPAPTSALRRLRRRAGGAPRGTSSRTAPSRPTTATPTPAPRRWSAAEAAAHLPRGPGRAASTPAEATAFRRHMLLEMARMSCDDGLVMTLHPGVHRNHHPATFARYGPDTGHDIPVAVRVHRRAAAAARALRHPPEPAPGAVHRWTRRCSRREIAPLAGFYPSVYVGAPWWFLDAPDADPAVPGGRHRDRRASAGRRASSTTPAPSARSRPGTTCPAASTPASWPGWSPSTGSTRTRRSRRRSTWSPTSRGRCSSCDRHSPAPRLPRGAAGPRPSTSASATSSAPTRPGTPTRAGRRRLGHRRVHRPQRRARRRARRPGRALHADRPRARTVDEFAVVRSVSEAHPGADLDAWLRLPGAGPQVAVRHADRHRGRLPPDRRRRSPRSRRHRRRRRDPCAVPALLAPAARRGRRRPADDRALRQPAGERGGTARGGPRARRRRRSRRWPTGSTTRSRS